MNLRYLVVDGHNVLFDQPDRRRVHDTQPSLAREQLANDLQALQDSSHWRVTLVFDGRQAGERLPARHGATIKSPRDISAPIVISYSTVDLSADGVIERLVATSGKATEITVVTADQAERATVEAFGAFVQTPSWLESELKAHRVALQSHLDRVHARSRWPSV